MRSIINDDFQVGSFVACVLSVAHAKFQDFIVIVVIFTFISWIFDRSSWNGKEPENFFEFFSKGAEKISDPAWPSGLFRFVEGL